MEASLKQALLSYFFIVKFAGWLAGTPHRYGIPNLKVKSL